MSTSLETLVGKPEYQALLHKRKQFVWPLLLLTVAAYFVFILAIAFAPAALGKPLHEGGTISIGIVFGLGLILFNFVITLIYVRAANRHIEPLIKNVHTAVGE